MNFPFYERLSETQKTGFGIVLIGIVVAFIVFLLRAYPTERTNFLTGVPSALPTDGGTTFSQHVDELEAPVVDIMYQCAGGEEFLARVEVRRDATLENPGHAEVFLEDGSKILLTQTLADRGVRYENSGGVFVLMIDETGARVEEGGRVLFAGCRAQVQTGA
jgi:hypothetical protein